MPSAETAMDELERLRCLLAEEQRRREEEQGRREEEQRRREEEQRRREEEQRRREEAESRALDEQWRREEAELLARASQLQTLGSYLDTCHSLGLAIEVLTDRSLTTQGDTTNPAGRIYPRRIIPWGDFLSSQAAIWARLSEPSFDSQPKFPSQHQLDYVRSLISPISSEHGLRYFERDTVENAVQKLVDAVYDTPALRDRLGLRGTVTFESHTNLGNIGDSLSESLERLALVQTGDADGAHAAPVSCHWPQRTGKGKGKRHRADQFCIYRTMDGAKIPVTAIEYKAPHKLSQDEVVVGLASEIQPERDVINQDGEGFAFASRWLAAAVVTQLFSYMISKSIQYGYVCTGQAFVFLYIPDDPATVYYHACVPNLDVLDGDEDRLHYTAVAQVFAFVLLSLQSAPPPLSWRDAALGLDVWAVEFEDVLSKIPETVRKGKERSASPYKPQRWRGFKRSPIRTRSRCQQAKTTSVTRDDDEDGDAPPSPTLDRAARSGRKIATSDTSPRSRRGRPGKGDQPHGVRQREGIQDRPYCTHTCLFGLAYGGQTDESCPNASSHGPTHLGPEAFLHLLRDQLAEDRGPDADSAPLYISGSVGSLFKIRLSSHGYTLIVKGVERADLARLQHEKNVYDRLRSIQGKYVPVCVGLLDLVLPLYYDGGVFGHVLLLSWAGRPMSTCVGLINRAATIDTITRAFSALHRLNVRHGDAELRNIVYDEAPMIVDFERAELYNRQPLGPISPNVQNRKSKGAVLPKKGIDVFEAELQSVVESISRWSVKTG